MTTYLKAGSDFEENVDSVATKKAWFIWGFAALFFFAEYFARVAPVIMTSQLYESLMIGATGFGSLTACFYWTYIPMQLPVGLLVDRYSVRWQLSIMAFLTAFSCAIFASSIGLAMACFSRLLLGFGAAFAFVGAIKLAADWFPASKLGMIAGFTQAIGMLGAASGELPVAYLVEHFGWRVSMWCMAAGFTLLSFALATIIRDRPSKKLPKELSGNNHNIVSSLYIVLSNPQTWWNAFYAGFLFVPSAVLGESWGVEYLKYSHQIDYHHAAFANSMIFIGWAIGGPIAGNISDRLGRRKIVMMLSAFLSLACMVALVWGPQMTWQQLACLLFIYGVSNTGVGVSYALATEINPKKERGVSIAFANMGSILIGAVLLPLVGKLIDWHNKLSLNSISYTGADFEFAMNLLPIALILSLLSLCFLKETYCQQQG